MLKRRVSHTRGDRNRFFVRCACDGKPALISFAIGFRRIRQRDIDELSGDERSLGGLLKFESHRALGDLPACLQRVPVA